MRDDATGDEAFAAEIAALAASDALLARCLEVPGPVLRFTRMSGFAGLLQIILGQQVSSVVAATLWRKLQDELQGVMTPVSFLARDAEALRRCGFSRQKVAYATGLAEAMNSGRLDLESLADFEDDAALETLIGLKGIGRWSAELYLLAGMGRPDIWPVDDLAIATGMQWLLGLESRPSRTALIERAEPWRPRRSAAAHMVWHFYSGTVAARKKAVRSGKGTIGEIA